MNPVSVWAFTQYYYIVVVLPPKNPGEETHVDVHPVPRNTNLSLHRKKLIVVGRSTVPMLFS